MSGKNVYLVSGANRGIGYGLAAAIAARPNTIFFGGARDPTAQSLKELAAKHPNVHSVKITSGDKVDDEAAITEIQKTARQLDVVIANAGMPCSIRRYMSMSASASGSSKTAANFLIKVLDVENPSLITLAISPGWLATDMGNDGAARNDLGSIQRAPGKRDKGKEQWKILELQVSNDGNPWEIETDEVP
ncbi:NAD(P)-binding protein [Mycena olivaceomarginata]|nr:NAD(P)-binding protein [Mycena olivaceomarginata]